MAVSGLDAGGLTSANTRAPPVPSCPTQVPHNLAAPVLDMARGSIAEWPFYAYGLSDGRWTDYNAGGNGKFFKWRP